MTADRIIFFLLLLYNIVWIKLLTPFCVFSFESTIFAAIQFCVSNLFFFNLFHYLVLT